MVNSFLNGLKALFPQYCLLCGLHSHREVPLCGPCEAELPANSCCCSRCALPLPLVLPSTAQAKAQAQTKVTPENHLCGQCLRSPPPFTSAIVPWLYSDQLAYIIQRWKYGREWRLTALLAYLWHQQTRCQDHVDLVVPVPLHWRKRWRRGANQAELMCSQLLSSQIPSAPRMERSLVHRHRATPAQSSLGAAARQANLSGAFTVHGCCDNLNIAVVDDVLTTGATATALTDALLAAGARRVDIWCLARTPPPGSGTG